MNETEQRGAIAESSQPTQQRLNRPVIAITPATGYLVFFKLFVRIFPLAVGSKK